MIKAGPNKRYYALSVLWLALHATAFLTIGCFLILLMNHFFKIPGNNGDVALATVLLVSVWVVVYLLWSMSTSSTKDVKRSFEISGGRWKYSGRCFVCRLENGSSVAVNLDRRLRDYFPAVGISKRMERNGGRITRMPFVDQNAAGRFSVLYMAYMTSVVVALPSSIALFSGENNTLYPPSEWRSLLAKEGDAERNIINFLERLGGKYGWDHIEGVAVDDGCVVVAFRFGTWMGKSFVSSLEEVLDKAENSGQLVKTSRREKRYDHAMEVAGRWAGCTECLEVV